MKLKNLPLKNHWANFKQTLHKAFFLVKGIQICSNEGSRIFPRGVNKTYSENTLTKFKNLLLQNHWANFNQTWHKASLSEGDSNLFK